MAKLNIAWNETFMIHPNTSANSTGKVNTGGESNSIGKNLNDDLSDIPVVAFVFLIIFIFLIFLASFIGNVFVFVIFYKRRTQLMTISNRFVMNLSVSSFLMAVCVMPFSIVTTITHQWHFGDGWCQITGMLTTLLFSACILTLLLISCDRYAAIISPLHYSMRFTTDRSSYMIAGVWALSVLYALPPVFGWNHIEFQAAKGSCTVYWRNSELKHMSYTVFLTTLCFVLPFSIMLWIYIVLFRATKKITARARRTSIQPETSSVDFVPEDQRTTSRRGSSNSLIFVRKNSNSNGTPLRRQDSFANGRRRSSLVARSLASLFHKDDWKAAKTGLVVIATFLMCWSPYFVVILIESVFGGQTHIPAIVQCLAFWVALSASAINPIVYVFRNKTIRKEFKILLRRGSVTKDIVQMRPCRGSIDSDVGPQERARLARTLVSRIASQNGSSVTVQTNLSQTKSPELDSGYSSNGKIPNTETLAAGNPCRNGLNNNTCRTSVSTATIGLDTMSRVDI